MQEGSFDTYIFGMSKHDKDDYDGLLSMWRGYGGQGSGAAIVFDASRLTPEASSPINIDEVKYGAPIHRRDMLISIIKDWCAVLKATSIPDANLPPATFSVCDLIKLNALTTKHREAALKNRSGAPSTFMTAIRRSCYRTI